MPGRTRRGGAALLFAVAAVGLGATPIPAAARDDAAIRGSVGPDAQAPANGDERASAPDVTIGAQGLEIESPDGAFSIEVAGRLHADFARHVDDDAIRPTDGTELRRARVSLGGHVHENWEWMAETDFAGNEVAVKDFWLAYSGIDGVRLTAGKQKQPYSLAVEMSSNDIPFVERPVDVAMIAPFVDRAVGVRSDASGARWFGATGLFGETGEDKGWGWAGRFVHAPVLDDRRVVHLGLRAAYREPEYDDGAVRIRSETTHFSDVYVTDTGRLLDVDSVSLLGPEAALVAGPFSLLAEYTRASLESAAGDVDFDGWHVGATWTLGGESRAESYDIESGEFKRLAPSRGFTRGAGGGTWELAARYASVDLDDGNIEGGSEDRVTLAANWYANSNIRVMLDWTRVVDTDESNDVRIAVEGLDVLTFRAQLAF